MNRLLIIGCLGLIAMQNSSNGLTRMLPEAVELYKHKIPDRIYSPENLFEYINGGAELFISYGFRKALSRTYVKTGSPDIVVDIFDMGTAKDAFGVFSQSRERDDGIAGQGSEYGGGLLTFWQSCYYVSILCYPESNETRSLLSELAASISQSIREKGDQPRILILLKGEDVLPASIRYFHHYIWLNSHYFISNDNILGINHETDAIIVKYRPGFHLLVVIFPTIERAIAAKHNFISTVIHPSSVTANELGMERWTGCRSVGRMFVAVLQAPDEKTGNMVINAIEKNYKTGGFDES